MILPPDPGPIILRVDAGCYVDVNGQEWLDFDMQDEEHPGTELMRIEFPDGFGNCEFCGKPITRGYVNTDGFGPNQERPPEIVCDEQVEIR